MCTIVWRLEARYEFMSEANPGGEARISNG